VAEHGEQSRERLDIARLGDGEQMRAGQHAQRHGDCTLEHVEGESGGAQTLAAGAHHVGGANVAAAYRADVLMPKEAHEQVARGDGPEQVRAYRDEYCCKEHSETEFSK
jgi:hypothetical protein